MFLKAPKLNSNNYTLGNFVDSVAANRIVPCLFLFLVIPFVGFSQMVTERIKLNQEGFYPFAPKLAIVTGAMDDSEFYITATNLRDTMFRGKLGAQVKSRNSATLTRVADFSSFSRVGSFVVLVPGIGHSYVFAISNNANRSAAIAGLKGFYYQRVSMPLLPQFAGKWHRSAGHPDNMVLIHPSAASGPRPAGTIISSPGGWYDAGDYNKYIVNSGITMGTLLSAYEDFPQYFKALNTNIPESNDAVPDVLNEIVYNLRWMFTMQDPNDGGVYNKCTNASFDGMVMPGITKAPRYVVQKGTAATLDFAAVTAQAARVLQAFKVQLPGLADSCLQASVKAWKWSVVNPAVDYDQNKNNNNYEPKITTGAYGDRNYNDEWFWAAAELFATTKQRAYYDLLSTKMKDTLSLPTWNNVGALGTYTLARLGAVMPTYSKATTDKARASIVQFAESLLPAVSNNAFRTIMGQSSRDFNWGSSSNAANQGIALANAFLLTSNKKYLDHALSNLDYLLGRNATGYCFLTGAGSKSPMHPHHRPSVADGVTEPVPGLLSGGPNPGKQDKCAYDFDEPETTFADVDCSYASNEIAINWNAPFVYLANAIEALQQKVGYTKAAVTR